MAKKSLLLFATMVASFLVMIPWLVESRYAVGITWKISVDPKITELIVTVPPFDELGIDDCVDKVYSRMIDQYTFRWVFIPNCIQNGLVQVDAVFRESNRYYSRPVVQISVDFAVKNSRMYTIPIDAHGSNNVTLHVSQAIQYTIDTIEQIKQSNNNRLIAKLNAASSGTGMFSHIGSKNGLQMRRTSSPLSSKMLCSSSSASVSLWEITNVDANGGHTILTVDNDLHYLPPSSVMNITVSMKPPYNIYTEVARWIGKQRWSDGLETLRPAILPAISPGYDQACFCGLHVPCADSISRSIVMSTSMMISKHDIFDQTRVASQRFETVLATMVFGSSEISLLNSLLLFLGVILCVVAFLVLFRDAGSILPDTAASRRYERSLNDASTMPYDEAELERQREIKYARYTKQQRKEATLPKKNKRKEKKGSNTDATGTDNTFQVVTTTTPDTMPSNASRW